jgi:hypothetical protein
VVTEKAMTLESYLIELKGTKTSFNSEDLLEIAWGLQQLCVRIKKKRIFSIRLISFSACTYLSS